jgi:hypothetical protein
VISDDVCDEVDSAKVTAINRAWTRRLAVEVKGRAARWTLPRSGVDRIENDKHIPSSALQTSGFVRIDGPGRIGAGVDLWAAGDSSVANTTGDCDDLAIQRARSTQAATEVSVGVDPRPFQPFQRG